MQVGVVGGGIVGLLSALRLQQRGAHVTVYDKSHIGKEASWAAAGLLAPEVEGLDAEAVAARDAYPALLAELGGDIPYGRGLQCGERFYASEAWVDPRALVPAIARACVKAGVTLREHTAVDMPPEPIVVLAKGAWSRDVRPIKGVLLRLKATLPHIYYWHSGYAVPRPGGECIVGASMEDTGFDKGVTDDACQRILSEARARVALLEDAPVLDCWAGLRPYADKPVLRQEGNVFTATGHFRNGILLAPHAAAWVAERVVVASGH